MRFMSVSVAVLTVATTGCTELKCKPDQKRFGNRCINLADLGSSATADASTEDAAQVDAHVSESEPATDAASGAAPNCDGKPDEESCTPEQDAGACDADCGTQAPECEPLPDSTMFGVVCSTASGRQGFRLCEGDKPIGECRTLEELMADSGVAADSGVDDDAGLHAQDSGAADSGLMCPSGYECSNLIGSLIGTIVPQFANYSICAEVEAISPPSCSTPDADCYVGSAMGKCQTFPIVGNACSVRCTLTE